MTKTYCDVCGAEITENMPLENAGTLQRALQAATVRDICADCRDAAGEVNWPAIIKNVINLYNPKVREQKEA